MPPSKIANARYVNMSTTLSEAEAARFMDWLERQDPRPTKSEAIRGFLLAGIGVPNTRESGD
jgi:hypothetical protein